MNFNQVVADVALILIGLVGNVLTAISDLLNVGLHLVPKPPFSELVMFPHGAQKVVGSFGGSGFASSTAFFTDKMGIPAVFAFLAGMQQATSRWTEDNSFRSSLWKD